MQMDNGEIIRSYKSAKNKKEQITILAELNACSEDEILQILSKELKPQELPRKREKTMSEDKNKTIVDNDKLKAKIIDLENENKEMRCYITEREDTIKKLETELSARTDQIEQLRKAVSIRDEKIIDIDSSNDEFYYGNPITVAQCLVDKTVTSNDLFGHKCENFYYSKSELKQIAEHLMVYVNNSEDDR